MPNPSQPDSDASRLDLIRKLSSLPPTDIDTLVASVSGASRYDTPTLPVPTRVAKLIEFAESGNGPGLREVSDTAQALFPNLFPH